MVPLELQAKGEYFVAPAGPYLYGVITLLGSPNLYLTYPKICIIKRLKFCWCNFTVTTSYI